MAFDLPRPTTRTASRCTSQMARGTHAFEIAGYSLHQDLGAGNFIRSAAFDVGGYSWCIRFYPDGYVDEGGADSRNDDKVAAFLELLSKNAMVRARCDFRLVDSSTGLSTSVFSTAVPQVFDSRDAKEVTSVAWGTDEFMMRSELEESIYIHDDRIVVECDVTVIKEPRVEETFEVDVPPSDLPSDFGKLLEMMHLADVIFSVKGEVFLAHKAVLAVRSPVLLEAAEKGCVIRIIEDMEPSTFKEFLGFIYTDSFPDDMINGSEKLDVVMQLLVAADKYCMERLKLICEGILCKSVDAKTVAAMLALAELYRCDNLKDACVRYINYYYSSRAGNPEARQPYKLLQGSLSAIFVHLREKARKLGMSLFRLK